MQQAQLQHHQRQLQLLFDVKHQQKREAAIRQYQQELFQCRLQQLQQQESMLTRLAATQQQHQQQLQLPQLLTMAD